MTTHSRGYDFEKKMVFSVLMIVMIVDMVMMRDGYIMYMSVTYRPFLWRVTPMNYFQVRSKKTPQILDLVLTLAADLFEASSKLPWVFIWILVGNNHGPTLPLVVVEITVQLNYITLFIWMLGCFYIQNSWIPQLLMAYNRYICNNPSSFNPPKLNKTENLDWLQWLHDVFSSGHFIPRREVPRDTTALWQCAERPKEGTLEGDIDPNILPHSMTLEFEGVIGIPLDFATQQKNIIVAACKNTSESMGIHY